MPLTFDAPSHTNAAVLTIGCGSGPIRGMVNCTAAQPLNIVLEQAQDYFDEVRLLRGGFVMPVAAAITKSGFKIGGSRGTTVVCPATTAIGALDVATGIEGVEIEGIEWQVPTPTSGQSLFKFGAAGVDHKVRRNKFYIHPSTTYDVISLASPMKILDFQSIVGKTVEDNSFLPYTDVIPVWLENGNGAHVANNRIHNGAAFDLDTLVGLQFFPVARPCKIGIYMLNERHGWIHHNQFWALGNPTNSPDDKQMSSVIQYDYNKSYSATTGECGHMEISDNQMELCYSPKHIYLRGLSYSNIKNNNIGVQSTTTPMLTNGAGKGAIVFEAGTVNDGTDKSKWCVVSNNNLHNIGKLNTAAAAVSTTDSDNISIVNNQCLNLFNLYAVYLGERSTNITIRDLIADFNASSANNYPVAIVGTDVAGTSGLAFTATNGTDTITHTGKDFATGTRIQVTNSGGALPGGLSAATNYFTIRQTATTSKLATTVANALAGTVVNLTDDGTGTQTLAVAIPQTNRIIVGEITANGADGAGTTASVVNTSTADLLLVSGLGRLQLGTTANPGAADTPDNLTTNLRLWNGLGTTGT